LLCPGYVIFALPLQANFFSGSTGSFDNMLDWVARCIDKLPVATKDATAVQKDAQTDNGLRNIAISTDPPYYDNIVYADLSDFFYIWLRKSLNNVYPELFRTILVPKDEEIVAAQYRFDGNKQKANEFFENGMLKAFKQIYLYSSEDIPVTVYYAYKQSEKDGEKTSSTGWETMLSAVIQSGFSITGTWPIRTEMQNRSTGIDSNALASSIVLVCRKRPQDAPFCTRRDFINALKRELKPALRKLQQSSIAPVDLAQASIGPGMAVYSRFSKVLEADGAPLSVRSALQIINQELNFYLADQDDEFDNDSQFCVEIYAQFGFNGMKFGEADVLARAKNTSVEKLRARGALYAEKGVVRLLTREEISENENHEFIWLLTQQLTRAMKNGVKHVAQIVAGISTSEPERAKALAYRLHQIADRKGWSIDAHDYNELVFEWPNVQKRVIEISLNIKNINKITVFDILDGK
jgi:putative DNA methylase